MDTILSCALSRWSPGIGDPTLAGWVTVASYAAAAAVSLRQAASSRSGSAPSAERAFWGLSGLYLAALAVNKQLDLQTLMTDAGRCAARLQGWYEVRRAVQVDVILTLVAASLITGLLAGWFLRRSLGRTGIALLGLVWITGFVLVRAIGFHHIDALIGLRVVGVRANWLFELGGIGLFIVGAACVPAARGRRMRH